MPSPLNTWSLCAALCCRRIFLSLVIAAPYRCVDASASRWEFEKKGKRLEIAAQGPLITNNSAVGVEAALQGLGIAFSL